MHQNKFIKSLLKYSLIPQMIHLQINYFKKQLLMIEFKRPVPKIKVTYTVSGPK